LFYNRFKIRQENIFRGINDTANNAKKAGTMLAGGRKQHGGTSCGMHTVDLCIKHAIGMNVRKRNRVVTDSFPPGQALKKRIHDFLSATKNKKSKARTTAYFKMCKAILGCTALVLQLPNVTRVSGYYLMVLSALRSKSILTLFAFNSIYKDVLFPLNLTPDEWQKAAEFESVLGQMNVLAMEVQKDDPGAIAFTWLEITMCRRQLASLTSFKVFDNSKTWTPQTPVSEIPTIEMKREELHADTRELLSRLEKEFNRYLPEPDSDQLMAMVLHPVHVAVAFP
jgi:hypothetical protein